MNTSIFGRALNGMQRVALLGAALLLAANVASAASFDCAKASTKVEKMICADSELSKLDEDLSAAYKKALKKSPDPSALKKQQRYWIKNRKKCQNVDCLLPSYKKRIAELNAIQEEKKATASNVAIETYTLVMSKNDDVCNYISRLMNNDLRQFGRAYSSNDRFVSTQDVFNAVPWKPAKASNKSGGKIHYWDVEGALFDLNNDGSLDFVVRDKGYLSGIRADSIYVLSENAAKHANTLLASDLFGSKNQINLTQVIYELSAPLRGQSANLWLISPFIYHDVSYLYLQSLYKKDEAIGGDFVVIAKYDGGDVSYGNVGEIIKDICYIRRDRSN